MAAGWETWTLERQLSRPGAVTSCAWSPDGMRLVSVGGGRVGVWDVFTGREVGVTQYEPAARLQAPRIHPIRVRPRPLYPPRAPLPGCFSYAQF
jgi:hypothetical protein